MNDLEPLTIGDALARTSEVLRPGEQVALPDYLVRARPGDAHRRVVRREQDP
jgi:hypothetical protein